MFKIKCSTCVTHHSRPQKKPPPTLNLNSTAEPNIVSENIEHPTHNFTSNFGFWKRNVSTARVYSAFKSYQNIFIFNYSQIKLLLFLVEISLFRKQIMPVTHNFGILFRSLHEKVAVAKKKISFRDWTVRCWCSHLPSPSPRTTSTNPYLLHYFQELLMYHLKFLERRNTKRGKRRKERAVYQIVLHFRMEVRRTEAHTKKTHQYFNILLLIFQTLPRRMPVANEMRLPDERKMAWKWNGINRNIRVSLKEMSVCVCVYGIGECRRGVERGRVRAKGRWWATVHELLVTRMLRIHIINSNFKCNVFSAFPVGF